MQNLSLLQQQNVFCGFKKKIASLDIFQCLFTNLCFFKEINRRKKLENPSARYPSETKNKIQKLFALILVVSKYQAKKQQENKINNSNNNLYECKMFFLLNLFHEKMCHILKILSKLFAYTPHSVYYPWSQLQENKLLTPAAH